MSSNPSQLPACMICAFCSPIGRMHDMHSDDLVKYKGLLIVLSCHTEAKVYLCQLSQTPLLKG